MGVYKLVLTYANVPRAEVDRIATACYKTGEPPADDYEIEVIEEDDSLAGFRSEVERVAPPPVKEALATLIEYATSQGRELIEDRTNTYLLIGTDNDSTEVFLNLHQT